jgi:SAM-dependent methyltransferase
MLGGRHSGGIQDWQRDGRMDRILEPEIMDGEAEAAAYAKADFSDSNDAFVSDIVTRFGAHLGRVADLGCGPADITVLLARAAAQARITAVDGSAAMLALARRNVDGANLGGRIELIHARLPGLDLPRQGFDLVLCKDMMHHLPDPQVLWSEIRRLARPGAAVCVMDLARPASTDEARAIVERVSANEDPILKEDFYNSLCAAFTADEVRAQLATAGLVLPVSQLTERHLCVRGRLPG